MSTVDAATAGMDRLQAVVLDVDGTLVNSERDGHRVAFNLAFEEAGMSDCWGVEQYGELLAVPGGKRRLMHYFEQRDVPEDEREELAGRLHERKTEIFTEMAKAGEIKARPGVSELIDELVAAGVRLGVATTGSRTWVDPLLDRLFGLERFEAIVGGDEVPNPKPDPAAHRTATERLGVAAQFAPAIEDSAIGLRAAKAAGLACAVVSNDYTRDQDFGSADVVLAGFGLPDSPAEVLSDPLGLDPPGRLDVATLRALAARTAAPSEGV
jgi:HAD superfamily hydrolase (TIGR01509 family)